MLICISGGEFSGTKELEQYLIKNYHYQTLPQPSALQKNDLNKPESRDDYVLKNWTKDFVYVCNEEAELSSLRVRPYTMHIHLDAPVENRALKFLAGNEKDYAHGLETIISHDRPYNLTRLAREANVLVDTTNAQTEAQYNDLYKKLCEKHELLNPERIRPSWTTYFMKLSDLAAHRSNCMKRRVGCVLVRDNVVVSTGYNGTPRGMTNCNEGGCDRCNKAQGSGANLSTCLCLHAEENAIIEAGRARTVGGSLFCNTCPCLTCSVKIVQSGIKRVVYAQSYHMDASSKKVLTEGGVTVEQYTPPQEVLHQAQNTLPANGSVPQNIEHSHLYNSACKSQVYGSSNGGPVELEQQPQINVLAE